jgi:putative GTP pyrophosphokinase
MTIKKSTENYSLPKEEQFFQAYGISKSEFEKAAVAWATLEEIAKRQSANIVSLEVAGALIVDHLRQVPSVHSLKLRAKSPEHLAEKVIRKRLEKPEIEITADNYTTHITDLIGVRALHLFKGDWKPIHDFIIETWDLHEEPLAYIREGDPKEVSDEFSAAGCNVKTHPHGYRSVHYLIVSQPTKDTVIIELQVRTIFEEGWSEIDHQIRYPYKKDDPLLSQYLVLFNRLAGNADEMGTFIKRLDHDIANARTLLDEAQKGMEKKEAKLRDAISKLAVSEKEKEKLQKQLDELSKSTYSFKVTSEPLTISALEISTSPTILNSTIPSVSSGLISSGVLGLSSMSCPTCGKTKSFLDKFCSNCGRAF